MREIFYEESAKIQNEKSASRKYNVCRVFSIIFYALSILVLFLLINNIPYYIEKLTGASALTIILNIVFLLIPLLLLFFSGFILGKFKNRLYIDYDYTFVSGSIRIAKVIKNVKRKFLLSFDYNAIERLGKYGSETYTSYEKMPGIKKIILTSNVVAEEGKEFYYLVINHEDNKKLLILECTEMFMVNILKFANKLVIEKDFK